jgi:hypothetical protein
MIFPSACCLNFFIINNNIDSLHHSLCSFIEHPISMTICGIPQECAFITFGIKFPKIFPVTKDVAFTSKSSEVLNRGLFTSPNLIGSLVCFRP